MCRCNIMYLSAFFNSAGLLNKKEHVQKQVVHILMTNVSISCSFSAGMETWSQRPQQGRSLAPSVPSVGCWSSLCLFPSSFPTSVASTIRTRELTSVGLRKFRSVELKTPRRGITSSNQSSFGREAGHQCLPLSNAPVKLHHFLFHLMLK